MRVVELSSFVFSNIEGKEKLCLEKCFPCTCTDTIDSLQMEGEIKCLKCM